MQPIQWSEVAQRLRRLTRTVGQQTVVLEEVVSPQISLGDVGVAPYRSEPRRIMVQLASGSAATPADPRVVQIFLPTGDKGCLVIRRASVFSSDRPDVTQVVKPALLCFVVPANGAAIATQVEPLVCPVGNIFGRIGPQLVAAAQSTLTTTTLSQRTISIAAAAAYAEPMGAVWDDLGIILPPETISGQRVGVGVMIEGTGGGGVNNLGITASFEAEYFLEYPIR